MNQQQPANSYQVGGQHYKTDYEHWDLVIDTGMGYLEGCATKYIARHSKKNGVEDLKKALHYVNKLLEQCARLAQMRRPNRKFILGQCISFYEANGLAGKECSAVTLLATWQTREDLTGARDIVLDLIDAYLAEPEAKPVPLTEENHHAERQTKFVDGLGRED